MIKFLLNKLKNTIKSKNILSVIFAVFVIILSVVFSTPARSSELDNISGFSWGADWLDNGRMVGGNYVIGSPDGIQNLPYEESGGPGWISLNCISGGNCGNIDYGLNLNKSTGDITGYAWSKYGWIKFGGLSEFPSGPLGGNTATNAKLTGTTVKGWARFCVVAANPKTCTGKAPINVKNGAWDGFLSLYGTSPSYGVHLDTTTGLLSGFAWGGNVDTLGNNNVGAGWVDFSNGVYAEVTQPTVTMSASVTNIPNGGSTTLTWTGIGLKQGAATCTPYGNWAGSGAKSYPAPAGGIKVGPLSTGSYLYSIECLGADGVTMSNRSTVAINVGGTTILNFYAEPSTAYPPYLTTLNWQAVSSIPGPAILTNCKAESGKAASGEQLNISEVPTWNPLTPISNPPSSASVNVPYNPTNYKLTCEDTFGTKISSTISVPRGTLPESVSLASDNVVQGPPNVYTTTMTWSTVNVVPNSCVASGAWSGNKTTPAGKQFNVNVPKTSPKFSTYTLTCTGLFSNQPIVVSILINEGSSKKFQQKIPRFQEQ